MIKTKTEQAQEAFENVKKQYGSEAVEVIIKAHQEVQKAQEDEQKDMKKIVDNWHF